jgi:hypothetical protein
VSNLKHLEFSRLSVTYNVSEPDVCMSAFLEMLVRFQIYDELKLLEVDHFVGK